VRQPATSSTSSTARGAGRRWLIAATLLVLTACGGPEAIDPAQSAGEFRPATILDAVLVGNRDAVEQFIAQGANVNAAEPDGTTLLMRAIHGGFPEIAKDLVDAGADVSATNRYGVSSLYLAARGADAKSVRALLAAGADANTSLPEGETALMTAAKAGDAASVRALLAGGRGSVTFASPPYSADAGVAASGYGATSVAPAEPRRGANPNAKEGWYGQTALMWAASEGHADVVRLLIEGGANVDEHSQALDAPVSSYERLAGDFVYPKVPKGRLTALHFAAREGALDVVQSLIEAGADLDAVDAEGVNALIFATVGGHLETTAALLAAGADPNVADSYGRTVLFAAVDLDAAAGRSAASGLGPADIVKLLLAKGADADVALTDKLPIDDRAGGQDSILGKGATPLFRAAMSNDLELMSLLLNAGADPLAVTESREPVDAAGLQRPSTGRTTALMAAAGVGWRESVRRGRDSEAIAALELLLGRGADVNAANQMGDTALHGAARRGSPAIIEFLLNHGANVRAKNARGQTPLDIASGVPGERIPYNEAAAALLRRLSQTG